MSERQPPRISPRKQPQQARSAELVAAILEAAIQVLVQEGAHRFTSARVAERAGVSVGSVYQYFPNKVAILFRLQLDEWKLTTAMLCKILEDADKAPLERLRMLVHAFIRTEFEEARVRLALNDAAPLYRDAAEGREMKEAWDRIFQRFMVEVLPQAPQAERALAGNLVITTLSTVGEHFSRGAHTPAEIAAYADAMADMFCAYLGRPPRQAAAPG